LTHTGAREQAMQALPLYSLAEPRRNFAEPRSNFAEPRKNFAEPRKNFAELRKNFVELRKNFVEPRRNFAELRKNFAGPRRSQETLRSFRPVTSVFSCGCPENTQAHFELYAICTPFAAMNENHIIRIFLTGYMGSGKTTLGRALARQMNLSYIDTDQFIENRYHKKVCDIFASEGEEQFRSIEYRILCEIAEIENTVISTGGGLPCFYDSMAMMNRTGTTIYLEASVEELAARLKASRTVRPVLQNRSGEELIHFIRENLEKRRPFYEQADIHFSTERMHTKGDVEVLAKQLEQLIYTNQ
jgi:shikimate kinase